MQIFDVSPDEAIEQRRIDEYIRREHAAKGRAMHLEMKGHGPTAHFETRREL